ncbi:MAG TPA: outer membrane lipoprotein carrier protein LolA, partial [Streptosporangiaceae bacterium]|nr:outer membrane lipoprotein carrier protein LolA [Streptosporangiaceae bacterium]
MGVIGKLPRQARWAVPAGAAAAVGLVIAGSALAGAQAAPQLPARSTAQLLAAVDARSALPSVLQATVQETANLGLPALPGSSTTDPLSGLSLLSGTHTFRIWYDGPTRVRIAIPVPMGEADLRRDGRDVWIWDSRTNQATHVVLPAGSDTGPAQETPVPNAPTPQQVARQILAAVGTTTTVGLQPDVTVAGRAAYQLSLAPKDSRSLIGQVRIAIDAEYSLPLQVQIFARGASSPALSVGYTSLSFTRPDPSNFPFTPPPGAKVKTVAVPAPEGLGPGGSWPAVPGTAPGMPSQVIQNLGNNGGGFYNVQDGTVRVRCGHLRIPASALKQLAAQLPRGMPRAARSALLKQLEAGPPGCPSVHSVPAVGWAGTPPSSVPGMPLGGILSGAPTVMGKDWLTVLVLPGGGLSAAGLPPGLPGGTVV